MPSSSSSSQTTLDLYMEYVLKGTISPLINTITSEIPRSFHNAIELGKQKASQIDNTSAWASQKEAIAKILRKTTQKYHLFSHRARANLDNFLFDNNFIEVAHQPKFLGGERFVLNKLACGGQLALLYPNSVPIFYIANYDQVHNELIKTHFPVLNSSSGLSIGIDREIETIFQGQCVECLPLPQETYLDEKFAEISEAYQFSINSCSFSQDKKTLLSDRVENAILLLKRTYIRSQNYSDWFLNIMGEIGNIINDYGYLFLNASDLELKQLLLPYYEDILQNSKRYIKLYNAHFDSLEIAGMNPPLRKLTSDFIPFFYECPCGHCNQRRIQLYLKENPSCTTLFGECPECKERIEIEFNPHSLDLSDHIKYLTPRVDTRQYLVSQAFKPVIHVAGTGETNYYMHTLPVLRKYQPEMVLPVIYFYNKTTLNTFMTRELEQQLLSSPLSDYLTYLKPLMKPLGKFNKLLKKTSINLEETSERSSNLLLEQSQAFSDMKNYLDQQLKNTTDQQTQNLVLSYLSNFMGKISRERSGQEAVFHWLDSAIQHGLPQILNDYQKIYQPWLRPGLPIVL